MNDSGTLEDLRAEADALGIDYHPKIGEEKLKQKIEDYYAEQEKEGSVQAKQTETETESVGKKKITEPKGNETRGQLMARIAGLSREEKIREKIKFNKKQRLVKRRVKITNNDKNEADEATTVVATLENGNMQPFGKVVPLDVVVELEVPLIKLIESIPLQTHRPKVVNGETSAELKTSVIKKKYTVSYMN